jgi:transposase
MAMVQVRRPSAGHAYYQRKLAEGKSAKEALRCLNAGSRMRSIGGGWLISGARRARSLTATRRDGATLARPWSTRTP